MALVSMLISATLIGHKKLNKPMQPIAVEVINSGINNQFYNENIVSAGDIISYITICFIVGEGPGIIANIGIIPYQPIPTFAFIYVINYVIMSIIGPCMFFVKKSQARKYLYDLR
jgi:hypothetical protein